MIQALAIAMALHKAPQPVEPPITSDFVNASYDSGLELGDGGFSPATPNFSLPPRSPGQEGNDRWCVDRCYQFLTRTGAVGYALAYVETSVDATGRVSCHCVFVGMKVLRNLP